VSRGAGIAAVAATIVVAAAAIDARPALAETPGQHAMVVDRSVVRFYAPETGGATKPRFVGQRILAFEARLAAMAEKAEGIGDDVEDRHVRDALEHHVGEELLASLARKLIIESPANKRPSETELAQVEKDIGVAMLERLGGRARVDAAAAAEQLDATEVDAILHRQSLAVWYLDRAVTPILQPSEEQLREVFRTSAHPFRGQSFEHARTSLQRWFVIERVRVAESAFVQAARARVRIVVTP
jgi:hypothetical protein